MIRLDHFRDVTKGIVKGGESGCKTEIMTTRQIVSANNVGVNFNRGVACTVGKQAY